MPPPDKTFAEAVTEFVRVTAPELQELLADVAVLKERMDICQSRCGERRGIRDGEIQGLRGDIEKLHVSVGQLLDTQNKFNEEHRVEKAANESGTKKFTAVITFLGVVFTSALSYLAANHAASAAAAAAIKAVSGK